MRFEINQTLAWIREQLNRACLWRWEITGFPQRDGSAYSFLYVGRKAHRELARIILGIENGTDTKQGRAEPPCQRVLISEMPFPGSICVPHYLRAVIPLGRTVEEIMAAYNDKLRRSIRKSRPLYRMQQAFSDAEIDYANRELLRPYATARHGSAATLKLTDEVRRCAQEFGRLDLVLSGDEVVACLLGNEHIRKGKRYWLVDRFGYPESVFSDPKRLAIINSINNHMALEWAIANGYDYYDIGLCFGRPDDGLLQWKKRRGAELDRTGLRGYGFFHVRLPKVGAAQLLWDTPLFAVEQQNLTLHLGLPDEPSDVEFLARYSQMNFAGLSKIYLRCKRPPGKHLLDTLRGFYQHVDSPPVLETIIST